MGMLPKGTLAAALIGALAATAGPALAQEGAGGGTLPPKPPRPTGGVPVEPPADNPAVPFEVSAGAKTVLDREISTARPTVFIFTRTSSTLERRFIDEICRIAGRRAGVGLVKLTTGSEPAAKKYEVTETPTALVFDRRGRFVSRSSDPEAIRTSVGKALGVMRIDWPAGDDPRVEESARIMGRPVPGGIMRTMTFQPEWMGMINALARKAHFSPGFLDVRTKEMIAAYVSALNDCRF